MTRLETDSHVTRETQTIYKGSPLVVTLTPHNVGIRQKGHKAEVQVPYEAILEIGYKILVNEERRNKK